MPDPRTFRIASYNIRKAIGGDRRRDPRRIQSVIAAIGANVFLLQEGDYRFRGRAPLFEAADLLRNTGLTVIDLDYGEPGLGWHGNVLLVGSSVEVAGVRLLALPALEPRGALVADLRIGGRAVQVVAGHLGLLAWNRRRQARAMMEATDPSPDMIVVALGDFNGWGRRPGSLAPFREAMSEVACGPSYPTRRPVAALDRIFHRGPIAPTGSGVWCDGAARVASDHLPIWADFRLG